MRRLKIQLHLPNLYVGGIERWALTLMHGTPDIDWFVSTPADAATHPSGLNEFRDFPQVGECGSPPGLDALITTWGTANRAVVPTIAVAHSAFDHYRAMMRTVRYDHAVAVSQEARTCFPEETAVDIIPNGVDVARLQGVEPRSSVRARLGITPDAVVIGYVGRWGFQKNPMAAATAASLIPGAVALYVGPLPDETGLQAAKALADCYFVSPEAVGNIGDLYACMDVCVFASRTEGFGLALAEAWYCRVPVVATRVGVAAEHPELVHLLPQEPSAGDLKDAVERALSAQSPVDLDKCRAIVEDRYTGDRMAETWKRYIVRQLSTQSG